MRYQIIFDKCIECCACSTLDCIEVGQGRLWCSIVHEREPTDKDKKRIVQEKEKEVPNEYK